jgi:hypothetical protein
MGLPVRRRGWPPMRGHARISFAFTRCALPG